MSVWAAAVWLKNQIGNLIDNKLGQPSLTGKGITFCELQNHLSGIEINAGYTRAIYVFIPPVSGIYNISITGSLYNANHTIRFGAMQELQYLLGWTAFSFDHFDTLADDSINDLRAESFNRIMTDYLIDKTSTRCDTSSVEDIFGLFEQVSFGTTSVGTKEFSVTLTKDIPAMVFAMNDTTYDAILDVDELKITYGNE